MSDPERRLYAYELHQAADMPLSIAPVDRAWMDASHQRAPYRCLPLVIANQAGWWLPCPATFTVYWDGGLDKENLQLNFAPPPETTNLFDLFTPITVSADMPNPVVQGNARISSHFGNGIVTFSIPYLFRTRAASTCGSRGRPTVSRTACIRWRASSKPTGCRPRLP